MVTRIRAALLLALARVGALVAPPSLRMRRRPAPRQAAAVQDLSGDGGVLKTATTGDGAPAFGNDGDVALLTYEARTASGQLLDRGVQTQYTVGDQQFIPGWDLCVRSLAVGERASFAVSSDYAYGISGVPPAVLENEPLTFEVTAIEYRGNIQTSASFASDAPLTPRTPGSIKAEFERRQAEKAVRASSDRALRDERDAGASPLDQVKNAFGNASKGGGIQFSAFGQPDPTSKEFEDQAVTQDMKNEAKKRFSLRTRHSKNLEKMAGHFEALLEAVMTSQTRSCCITSRDLSKQLL